jgi:hypothetical protein
MSAVCRDLGLPALQKDKVSADNTRYDNPRAARSELSRADKAKLEFSFRKTAAAVGYSIPMQQMASSGVHAAASRKRVVQGLGSNLPGSLL